MGIQLNHSGPASNTRACVRDPSVILNTCSNTDLAHAHDLTYRSADKIAVSDLLFHLYESVVLPFKDRHIAACFHKRSCTTHTFLETSTAH